MRRRDFLTAAFGGVAAASPFRAFAQQAPKLPMIGFMGAATPSAWAPWTSAFVRRLEELGWIDGKQSGLSIVGLKEVKNVTPK